MIAFRCGEGTAWRELVGAAGIHKCNVVDVRLHWAANRWACGGCQPLKAVFNG